MRIATLLGSIAACTGCEGPPGVDGQPGQPGKPGENGDAGAQGAIGPQGMPGPTGPAGSNGCEGLPAGATEGVSVKVTAAPPANGQFLAVGERGQLTIQLSDRCGRALHASDLATANLYLAGPRGALTTTTAAKMLNCVTDRNAADRQHHFVNLAKPSFADVTQTNLVEAPDGTITYSFGAVSNEPAGTYAAGVWAVGQDAHDQQMAIVDLQVAAAAAETYASGAPDQSSCEGCHRVAGGALEMHHSHPLAGIFPFGNFSLDGAPVASCKLCHNADGYSTNLAIRKVHGVHRGSAQAAAGVAHPEYGVPADPTLADYTDVGFPSLPDADKDCTKCHTDDRWKQMPSRVACGTCHDAVFFDQGVITPPHVLGRPSAGACKSDADCGGLGALATCNLTSGSCERTSHPIQIDDSQCTVCHTADQGGLSPISVRHAILSRTAVPGIKLTLVSTGGASGPNGTYLIGDTPSITFQLTNAAGTAIADLKTNAVYSATLIVAGPTDDRQRLLGPLTMKSTGTLTWDANAMAYTYLLPSPLPATAILPYNTTGGTPRGNGPGTYTMWMYANATVTVGTASVRDFAGLPIDFKLGADQPILPRQVVVSAACDSCHVQVQAHGGGRRDANLCSTCHTQGAVDRIVGAKGVACTSDAQCPGAAAGWEACSDTNNDGKLDACLVTVDPTPNQPIDLSVMIDRIHYGRLLEGYAESNNLVAPGKLQLLGFNNGLNDFSEDLLPVDVRSCQTCHADTNAACSANAPCGVGQSCVAGKCQNVAWTDPSARVCLSCHDADDAAGHAAIMTWQGPNGPVETCPVCHQDGAQFSVASVHQIVNPFVPPYAREPQ